MENHKSDFNFKHHKYAERLRPSKIYSEKNDCEKTEKKPRLAQIYLQVCEQTHESELKARTRDAPS